MKISYCLVAFMFLGASIYTMIKCTDCDIFKNYEASLDSDQHKIYKEIIKERMILYLKGLILGMILGGTFLYKFKGRFDPVKNSCIFVAITMATQYFVYQLSTKSNYMLNVIDKKDQAEKWLEVYLYMKKKYHCGIILGIIGYYILSIGILTN